MRYRTTVPHHVSNESIQSHMLVKHMVSEPDILPGITRLWRNDIAPLSAILADRGMFSTGLEKGTNTSKYRVVSQNHVQYAIESSDKVKVRLVANPSTGKAYQCDAYTATPGKNQSEVLLFVDDPWLSPKDVFEFGDADQTLGWIYEEKAFEQTTFGAYIIKVKKVTNSLDDYFDLDLLVEGAEIGFAMTAFEHDFSETAYEKYTFNEWGHAFMTLQRMKYSWSGYAENMQMGAKWIQTNTGKSVFLTDAEDKMMRRWAGSLEFANVFGKGTVTSDGDTIMKDSRNREIMVGDGLLNQGDGAFHYPMFEWNDAVMQGVLGDMRLKTGKTGKMEVVALLGPANMSSFTRYMAKKAVQFQTATVWGQKDEGVGMADTYSYYEFDGVRILPVRYNYFGDPDRPQVVLPDGTYQSSWEGILLSLGNSDTGDNGIEMVTIKNRYKMGSVNGINHGGDNMANSVDGGHRHILFQSGIINRSNEGVARMYRPALTVRS